VSTKYVDLRSTISHNEKLHDLHASRLIGQWNLRYYSVREMWKGLSRQGLHLNVWRQNILENVQLEDREDGSITFKTDVSDMLCR